MLGEQAGDTENNKKLLKELKGLEEGKTIKAVKTTDKNKACFVCQMVLMTGIDRGTGTSIGTNTGARFYSFLGTLEGHIASEMRYGKGEGFGYDPLFIPLGEKRTLAELGGNYKMNHSHRSRAMSQLILFLQTKGVLFPL